MQELLQKFRDGDWSDDSNFEQLLDLVQSQQLETLDLSGLILERRPKELKR